jgi:hypothetical protein
MSKTPIAAEDGLRGDGGNRSPLSPVLTGWSWTIKTNRSRTSALQRRRSHLRPRGAAELLGINLTTLASRLRALMITPAKAR